MQCSPPSLWLSSHCPYRLTPHFSPGWKSSLLLEILSKSSPRCPLQCFHGSDPILFSLGSKNSILKDAMAAGTPKSILLSASIKREGDSPTASPHSSDDIHHSDRYQVSRQASSLLSAVCGSQQLSIHSACL
uniref:Uncharacterized protein n=1 Tax=Meleagris gallopavo TaxID=9103 RepID=A0A803XL08_MELGA